MKVYYFLSISFSIFFEFEFKTDFYLFSKEHKVLNKMKII